MHQFSEKDWARRLAECGKQAYEIARLVDQPESVVKQWIGRITPSRQLAKWEDDYTPRDCTEPTSTPIGSPERVAVYAARYDAGLDLYHPQDSKEQAPPRYDHTKYYYTSGIQVCSVRLEKKAVGEI